MKNLIVLLFLISVYNSNIFGQSVQLDWAMNIGNEEIDKTEAIVQDSLGNVYLAGEFKGTVDFDHGPGVFNVTSFYPSGRDIYLVKLDPNGNFLWVKTFGGITHEDFIDMDLDSDGNLIIIGHLRDSVDFDLGPNDASLVTSVYNSPEGFILKIDLNGNFIWVKQIDANFVKLDIDYQNNILVTGDFNNFTGLTDFDPGGGTDYHTPVGTKDIFVLKLNSLGSFNWARTFGGNNFELVFDICTDSQGDIITVGEFAGTPDFDPSSSIHLETSVGSNDIFIHKLDENGNFIWIEPIGGNSEDGALSAEVDNNDNIYVAGYYLSSNIDFNPGSGTDIYDNILQSDGYILKLDAAGGFDWVKVFAGNGSFGAFSLKLDMDNSIYIGGSFSDSIDFDPSSNVFNMTANASPLDFCIVKLDSVGDFLWANHYGSLSSASSSSNNVSDISIIGIDTLLISGYYEDTVDFNAGPGIYNLVDKTTIIQWQTDKEGFCMKLIPCVASDSTIDVVTGCDSYTWIDGNIYTTDNSTATFTLANQQGCDSVVTLNLTMLSSETRIDTRTECVGYVWLNGITYYSNNNTDSLIIPGVATNGCDSIIYLDLTVTSVNTSFTQIDQLTLQANAVNSTYQWLDCDNNYSQISSETNISYTALINGNYAVEVTTDGCVDTSVCLPITSVGLDKVDPFNNVTIFPNPTKGIVSLNITDYNNISISIYNSLGQIIYRKEDINPTNYEFEIIGSPGVYTLELTIDNLSKQYKIVKE